MNYNSLYIGIYICILLQLIPLTIANGVQRNTQNKVLSIICFLFIVSILKIAFWTPIQETFLYWIIGGSHLFLFPVMLFLYVNEIAQFESNHIWRHWLIHLILYIFIHPIKLAVYGRPVDPFEESLYYLVIFLPLFIYYSLKAKSILKKEASENLNLKIYPRFKFFYYSVNLYLLSNIIFVLPLSINVHLDDPYLREFNYQYFFPTYLFLFRYLFIIPCIALIFYALTEISRLKRYIVSSGNNKKKVANLGEIDSLRQLIDKSNFYLNTKVNVISFMNEFDVNREFLTLFLEHNGFSNFNEMVNSLRLDDFKCRIKLMEYKKYDLVSVAKESGFNSKASFFRVFKQLEGITPNQYLNSLHSKGLKNSK